MKMISFAAALAAAAALSPAYAGDWDGFYVGAHGGYAWTQNDFTDVDGYSANPPGTVIQNDDNGFVGGVLAGFTHQMSGSVVVGLEADATLGDLGAANGAYDPTGLDETAVTDYDYLATFRARIGFTAGSTLFYVTGGGALAGFDNAVLDTDGGVFDPLDSFSDTSTKWGWVGGGGVEQQFGGGWFARAEGLYYDFGTRSNFVDIAGTNSQIDTKNTVLVARAALGYRF